LSLAVVSSRLALKWLIRPLRAVMTNRTYSECSTRISRNWIIEAAIRAIPTSWAVNHVHRSSWANLAWWAVNALVNARGAFHGHESTNWTRNRYSRDAVIIRWAQSISDLFLVASIAQVAVLAWVVGPCDW
jgi:hypothetical protein